MKKKSETAENAIQMDKFTRVICILAWFSAIFMIPAVKKAVRKWLVGKLTNTQARAAWHNVVQLAWPKYVGEKFWISTCSPLWYMFFDRWLYTSDSEGKLKGMFFETGVWSFSNSPDHPFVSPIIKKWLTLLTDWENKETSNTVWDLSHNWNVYSNWSCWTLIENLRYQFAVCMFTKAARLRDLSLAQRAHRFCERGRGLGQDERLNKQAYDLVCELYQQS